MRTWRRTAKQPRWCRTLKLARARWAEEDGDQRAAAFAYYLLLPLLLWCALKFLRTLIRTTNRVRHREKLPE